MAKEYLLTREQWVPKAIEDVFDFFSRPSNLQTLTPPWLNFHITESPRQLQAGSLIGYKLRVHGFPVHWTTEITQWNPPYSFVDTQISGPYSRWIHRHTFVPENNGTTVTDAVRYALPLGSLGRLAHWALVRRDVNMIFDFRSERMAHLFGTR